MFRQIEEDTVEGQVQCLNCKKLVAIKDLLKHEVISLKRNLSLVFLIVLFKGNLFEFKDKNS